MMRKGEMERRCNSFGSGEIEERKNADMASEQGGFFPCLVCRVMFFVDSMINYIVAASFFLIGMAVVVFFAPPS